MSDLKLEILIWLGLLFLAGIAIMVMIAGPVIGSWLASVL